MENTMSELGQELREVRKRLELAEDETLIELLKEKEEALIQNIEHCVRFEKIRRGIPTNKGKKFVPIWQKDDVMVGVTE